MAIGSSRLVFTDATEPSGAERARCTVCPRGCRLAVSWESWRVCTFVLEAVTLPCIEPRVRHTIIPTGTPLPSPSILDGLVRSLYSNSTVSFQFQERCSPVRINCTDTMLTIALVLRPIVAVKVIESEIIDARRCCGARLPRNHRMIVEKKKEALAQRNDWYRIIRTTV